MAAPRLPWKQAADQHETPSSVVELPGRLCVQNDFEMAACCRRNQPDGAAVLPGELPGDRQADPGSGGFADSPASPLERFEDPFPI